MTLYCGMDLHANNCLVAVLDDQDQLVFEKRLPNDLSVIMAQLSPYRAELDGCVVESTYNWYWLVDGLMAAGMNVKLANTAALKQYAGLKYTDDRRDARHLAHMLRLGLVPEGYIYPKTQRAVRDLLRRRMLLVHQRTMQHLSLQGLIARHTGQRLRSAQIKRLDAAGIAALLSEPAAALSAQLSLQVMQHLNEAIAQLEQAALDQCTPQTGYALLTSIPGVGRLLGMMILLETGNINRFANAGCYTSYARCVKAEKRSNDKRKGPGNRKNGNRYLAWAFMEAAHFATIWAPAIKRYYQRKAAKSHVLVAKKAVANKLARACFHMLKNQQPFELQRAFG